MVTNPLGLPPDIPVKDVFKTPQQKCEEKGGTWDGTKCVFQQSTKEDVPVSVASNPQDLPVVTDAQGNERLAPQNQTANEARQNEIDIINAQDPNFPSAATAQASNEEQARSAALVAQALSDLTPSELAAARAGVTDAPANLAQAFTAGTLGNLGTIAGATGAGAGGGAVTGAAVGSILPGIGTGIGAGVGGTIGAALGFAGAIYSGVKGNIAAQQKGEIAAAKDQLTQGRTNMQKLALLARQYPELSPQFALDMRNQRVNMVRARQQTKAETSGNLNRWMEDGRAELSDFDTFLQPGGTADIMQTRLALAASGQLTPMSDVEFQIALALIE